MRPEAQSRTLPGVSEALLLKPSSPARPVWETHCQSIAPSIWMTPRESRTSEGRKLPSAGES